MRRWQLAVTPFLATVLPLHAQRARWAVDGQTSRAWWLVDANHGHLWATTCPSETAAVTADSLFTGLGLRDAYAPRAVLHTGRYLELNFTIDSLVEVQRFATAPRVRERCPGRGVGSHMVVQQCDVATVRLPTLRQSGFAGALRQLAGLP